VYPIDEVWAGVLTGFDLLTYGNKQFVAYYDKERYLTVASRIVGSELWQYKRLPTQIGWDGHNYITMAIDNNNDLHVAGNMHAVPLIYFRTTTPLEIGTLTRFPTMVGTDENRVTYPEFLRGGSNEFLFTYRNGVSGNGNNYYNIYNHTSKTWSRFLSQPLFSGGGTMNAYPVGPIRGPTGLFHVVWVWRDPGGGHLNHDLSYAQSPDLRNWRKSNGTRITLPITINNGEIVDPVPVMGGLVNHTIGFDHQNRVIISYVKYDANGNSQIYQARLENGTWVKYRTTNWTHRWDLLGGTTPSLIDFEPIEPEDDGGLSQRFRHWIEGTGIWKLDPVTLRPVGNYVFPSRLPASLRQLESTYQCVEPDGTDPMRVRFQAEKGIRVSEADYVIRWEGIPDKSPQSMAPRECESPIPSTELRLYELPPLA
jgi:hypothetical protein